MARLSCIMDKDMDIVYICRNGENEELKYSIRSAVKNLTHDKVWVVGGKPDWYTGNYIQVDQTKAKYTNARNSLRAICNSEDISDSFILMNDDFYIINKVESVPYMYSGNLDDKIEQREDIFSGNTYTTLLKKTLGALARRKKDIILDYELHVPMIMNKKKLLSVLMVTGLWRSLYGNIFNVGGIQVKDVKVYDKKDRFYVNSYDINNLESDYISSNDDSFEIIKSLILEERFPSKTAYES